MSVFPPAFNRGMWRIVRHEELWDTSIFCHILMVSDIGNNLSSCISSSLFFH